MKQEEKRTEMLAVFLLSIPVIYLALCAAPYIENGLLGIIEGITAGIENPKSIRICEDSPKTVLVFFSSLRSGNSRLHIYKKELSERRRTRLCKMG